MDKCNKVCLKECIIEQNRIICPGITWIQLIYIILGIMVVISSFIIVYEIYQYYKTKNGYIRIRTKWIFYKFEKPTNMQELSVVPSLKQMSYAKGFTKREQLEMGQLLVGQDE